MLTHTIDISLHFVEKNGKSVMFQKADLEKISNIPLQTEINFKRLSK